MEDLKVTIPVFQNFFSLLKSYSEVDHFRSLIYGITTLIFSDEIPDIIKGSMNRIIPSLINLMRKYTRERVGEVKNKVEEKKVTFEENTEEFSVLEKQLAKLEGSYIVVV